MSKSKKKNNTKKRSADKKLYTIQEYDKRLIMTITTIFLCYMFILYPLFLHDKYFDITMTKYHILKVGIIIYAFFMCVAVSLKIMDGTAYQRKKKKSFDFRNSLQAEDVFMAAFLLSGFFAWLMADNRKAAFTGELGRRCGLQFMILMFVMYLCLACAYQLSAFVFPVFSIVSSAAYLLGICQHMGKDVFGLLNNIAYNANSYISTFGNINTFAGFICITLALFMGFYLFERRFWKKLIFGCSIVLGFASIITANSDIAYAGCGAAIVALLFIAVYFRKIYEYLQVALLGGIGYTFMAYFIRYHGKNARKLTGLSLIAEHVGFLILCLAVLIVLLILCKWNALREKKKSVKGQPVEMNENPKASKSRMFLLAVVVFFIMLAVVIYGRLHHWAVFTFNDQWGTYRGFVWSRLIKLYQDFPFLNKLFGNGNESVYSLMYANYHDEMLALTKTVYDNAHNEYLQYLVTLGAFGFISYLGLIISALINSVKYGKKKPEILIIGLGLFAYQIQAFFNVNQPITTPYAFLLMGLLAGMCRYERKQEVHS